MSRPTRKNSRVGATELSSTYARRRGDVIQASTNLRGKGVVCFTWDDNFSDWLTEVLAPARALGQRHTFAIQTGTIGTAGHLAAADILQMFNDGHEIASHSVSHLDMTTLTVPQQVSELEDSKATLETIIGAGKVTSWHWPYGSALALQKTMAYGRYDRNVFANGTYGFMYRGFDTIALGNIGRYNWTDLNTANVQALIRMAATQPVRLVIQCHDPGGVGYPSVADVAATLQLCYDLEVPCVPVKEAFSSWYAIPNPGFEDGLAGWVLANTGTGAAVAVVDTPDVGLSGTYSAKLSTADVTSVAAIAAPGHVQYGRGNWAIQGRARVTIRNAGTGGVFVEVEERDPAGNVVGTSVSTAIVSAGWVKFTKTFTPNIATSYATVRCRITNCDADAWFDHLSLSTANDVVG